MPLDIANRSGISQREGAQIGGGGDRSELVQIGRGREGGGI